MAEINTIEANPDSGGIEFVVPQESPKDPNILPSATDVSTQAILAPVVAPVPTEEPKVPSTLSVISFSAGYNFGKPDSPAQEIVTAKQAGKPIA